MKTSSSIKAISLALLKAQKEIEKVKKTAENPFYKSSYADLPSIIEAVKKPLNDNGIIILQPINKDFVETVLLHDSGEWIRSLTRIVTKEPNNPQAYGSAISYARRYAIQSLVFLSAEDDDGEGAMVRKPTEGIKTPQVASSNATACKYCGSSNKYHKLGCPNNPK